MKRRWTIAALLLGVLAALAVATAVAQVSPGPEPAATDAGTAEPDAVVDEAVAVADAAPAEPDAAPTVADVEEDGDEGTTDGRRVISRRREAALVGGWVRSELDAAAGAVAVDDLGLGANGEWVRRRSTISDETGLAGPPEETNGAWFTQESEIILLARGSAVDEVLRATFQIDDRSERLVLELPSGPTTFFRYR